MADRKSLQNNAVFSGKTLVYWAWRKEKSGLSATERAVGKYARAAFSKRKRSRAVCPNCYVLAISRRIPNCIIGLINPALIN